MSEPAERNSNVTKKEPPTSPFVTFGKTPPKVFKSKKLQLFSSNQDVALVRQQGDKLIDYFPDEQFLGLLKLFAFVGINNGVCF